MTRRRPRIGARIARGLLNIAAEVEADIQARDSFGQKNEGDADAEEAIEYIRRLAWWYQDRGDGNDG